MIRGRIKNDEDTMKTVILTPNSSVKSTSTIRDNSSQTRYSFYYPGCKKDANCNCEICIASINATLDLMPQSIHRSSLTKLSVSKPKIQRSPVSFPSTDFSTPKSCNRIRPVTSSPPPKNSTASVIFQKRRKRKLCYGVFLLKILLCLILVFGAEYGFSCMVSRVLKDSLSPELVKDLAENSSLHEGLNEKFLFLKNELEGLVGNKVSSCSSSDSVWKNNQDGLLLNSRCVLYESMAEEVSIWGWPLQTGGLLTAGYSSRSFSIISGRVTKWSTGEAGYSIRIANSSWAQGKWSCSMVQFDPNTWILEYKKGFLLENVKLVSAALDLLKFRLVKEMGNLRHDLWLLFQFLSRHSDFREGSILRPT